MAEESADDQLREMALHRGFKLVKSRRRKPGSGDYGKFGLTDAAGKPLLGFSDAGLTATARDVDDYLRGGAASSWQQSAKMTPDRPAERKARAKRAPAGREPIERPAARKKDERPGGGQSAEPERRKRRDGRPATRSVAVRKPEPEPELVVRPARKADAKALEAFLADRLEGAQHVPRNLQLALKQGVAIALLGPVVGCCFWVTLPTPQHGLVGRITYVSVADRFRRRGIGRQLVEQAAQALASKGCHLIEVMSDIQIRNFHGFFRSLGFEQKSYRFER